uniref:HNH endonuclease n=2 Tax=Aromatoleum toluolicum TaxID=90060 RepID=A0ABX1NA84_9RHOO|nr:HNH endonuclease [Aromatoleum toluolicum]
MCAQPYQGSRIKQQQDSKLTAPNQVSCLVADETALRAILRWYAGVPKEANAGPSLEQTRVAKVAADAGFDLTPNQQGCWVVFSSTAFPAWVGVVVQESGAYRLGLSDGVIGQRLGVEFGLVLSSESGPWATRFDGIEGYPRLHGILLRVAAISRVLHQEGLREFVATTRNSPSSTEAVREVVQRIGQDIFRRTLIEFWGGRCAVTGLDVVELLRASHIKPWADCESDAERLDVFNGLLLAPHLDALFDKGWVTFSDAGQLLRSSQLSDRQWALLGIEGTGVRAGSLADGHRDYLGWHRSKVFRGDAVPGTGAR